MGRGVVAVVVSGCTVVSDGRRIIGRRVGLGRRVVGGRLRLLSMLFPTVTVDNVVEGGSVAGLG